MKRQNTIIAILFFQLIFIIGHAQNNDVKFNLVQGLNGKPLDKINAITQDPYGYMWFCGQGERCLYRFDGNKWITFRHDDANPNSLGITQLETVYADSSGMIWAGGAGLDEYDPSTGIFKHYKHNDNDSNSLSKAYIGVLLKDHKGRLWVGTNDGLDCLDEKKGMFLHYRNEPGNPRSLSNNAIWSIYEDRKGVIWVGTGAPFFPPDKPNEDGGLNRLDPDGTFTRYLHDPKNPNSLINNRIRAIFEDSHGTFWVGTSGDGLHIMDREKGIFKRCLYNSERPDLLSRPPLKPGFAWDHITFINEDGTGAIWIGTYSAGLNRYDPLTKKVTHYQSGNGFPDSTTWGSHVSRDGVLWFSTEDSHLLFRAVPAPKTIPVVHSNRGANCFVEDQQKFLWVGTDGDGILRYDQQKKLVQRFNADSSNARGLFNNSIQVFFRRTEDSIWIGTYDGVGILTEHDQQISRFSLGFKFQDPKNSSIYSIFQDKQGIKWFATGEGIVTYNPANGTRKRYLPDEKDSSSIGSNRIISFLEDWDGEFWIGVLDNGINRLDRKTDRFHHYLKGFNGICLYQDSEGTIWAGTDKGLYRYNKKDDNFLPFFDAQSEINFDFIFGIIEDSEKNLWITTRSQIGKINSARNKTFIFDSKSGITPGSLHPNSIYKTTNGQVLIGYDGGFYAFFPEDLTANSDFNIIITDFFVNTVPVSPGKNSPIQKPAEELDDVVLQYNQNNFAFNFASTDYREPESMKYFFMLEGYDREWQEVKDKKEKSSYYFNLPKGKYVYRVKAFNSDGTKAERVITIYINPPWWQTWWAYSLYFLIVAGTIFAIYRYQKQRIIHNERQRRQLFELAQAKEIEKAYHELRSTQAQLIQSEKMASLGELTAGIAHEIQNPLNFVNNFSEVNTELIDEATQEIEKGNIGEAKLILSDIRENEQKINHHGKRADAIVKGMLQHSRSSSGIKEPANINALADEYLRLAYHGLRAKDKSFNAAMKTEFDETVGNINIIPQDIGRVILNLITNAFYAVREKKNQHADDNYEPTVTVSTKKMDKKVEIRVRDNGNGIPQKILDKIFQPFFTTKPTGQGTGLGLSLSYDIVKAHGGDLKAETKEGEFAEFIIQLPVT